MFLFFSQCANSVYVAPILLETDASYLQAGYFVQLINRNGLLGLVLR